MRLIGAAQRALEITCQRVTQRATFGKQLAEHQSVREDIADCFIDIETSRLLVLKACHKMDQVGAKDARDMIAAAKVGVPRTIQSVLDKCMQMHGAGGLTADYFLADAFNYARWCRQADGPDQVHQMALGKQLIKQWG
jgi:acyl-CoA dehydrogenase